MNKTVFNTIKGKIGLKAECILDTDEERQLVWDAIEKAERYKWHDLRQNPNDLPDTNMLRQIMFAWHGSNGCEWRDCGWFYTDEQEEKPYFSRCDVHMFVGDGYREVYAWKYIEPIEEVTDEKV